MRNDPEPPISIRHPPAKGLRILTWQQVEELDARINLLCAYAEQTGEELMMPIYVSLRGMPVKIGRPAILDKFKPGRI
jgi:hypothetical protein